jgi:hypothetical protein
MRLHTRRLTCVGVAQPRSVSEKDDKLLRDLMEDLEKQNAEVAGDEPEED